MNEELDDLKFEYELKIESLLHEIWLLKIQLGLNKIDYNQLQIAHSIEIRQK